MQNPNSIVPTDGNGGLSTVPENLPKIEVKPGWSTSQGQLTAIFVVASMVMAALGYRSITPEKIQNTYDLVANTLPYIIPLLASVPVLKNYINSRGKLYSNSMWATTALNAVNTPDISGPALVANFLASGTPGTANKGNVLGNILHNYGGMFGGTNWKDPQRYINIAEDVAGFIPGAGALTNILAHIGQGTNPGLPGVGTQMPGSNLPPVVRADPARTLTDKQILDAFNALDQNQQQMMAQLNIISNQLNPSQSAKTITQDQHVQTPPQAAPQAEPTGGPNAATGAGSGPIV